MKRKLEIKSKINQRRAKIKCHRCNGINELNAYKCIKCGLDFCFNKDAMFHTHTYIDSDKDRFELYSSHPKNNVQ